MGCENMNYSAIVLCAGKGSRSGLTYNKMLYRFKNKTVYEMTMDIFLNDERCKQIVVVTKEEELDDLKKLISSKKIDYVFGGKERQDSVYNGLQVVKEDYVLIHDGARPVSYTHLIEEIQAYVLAMNKFVDIAYEIYDIFGITINKLNAGGGFGICYTKADKPLEFELVVDTIMDIITKGFEARNLKCPMVLVEPGRYCVGNAGITLYLSLIHI